MNLVRRHPWSSAPVRPVRLLEFVVVTLWIEVDCSMDEAEDKSFGGPINDDVYSHIVGVY